MNSCILVCYTFISLFSQILLSQQLDSERLERQDFEIEGKRFTRKMEGQVYQLTFQEAGGVIYQEPDLSFEGTYTLVDTELKIQAKTNPSLTRSFLLYTSSMETFLLLWSENESPVDRDVRYYIEE